MNPIDATHLFVELTTSESLCMACFLLSSDAESSSEGSSFNFRLVFSRVSCTRCL